MSSSKAAFNPEGLPRYVDPPALLHFQWEGEQWGYDVFRYALVEMIDHNDICERTKRKDSEVGMSQWEIREKTLGALECCENKKGRSKA